MSKRAPLPPLTASQERVYNAIVAHYALCDYAPSVRELCRDTGLKSTSTVYSHLHSLEAKGYIKLGGHGKNRAMSVTATESRLKALEAAVAAMCARCILNAPLRAGESAVCWSDPDTCPLQEVR